MSTLLSTIQSIAVNAVKSTNPLEFTFGTVTQINPLKVRIDNSTVELAAESLILTANVVEKTITIKKHTHTESEELIDVESAVADTGGAVTFTNSGLPPTSAGITLKHNHTIDTTALEAYCTDHGEVLPFKQDPHDDTDDETVVTITRALKKGDKVIMLRVCSGQEYIIMSRVYEHK